MASYYTYGDMPDAQSTVYGGGLDDDRFYAPRGESVPIAPLSEAAPAPAPARYDEKGNLLPSADSPLSQMSGGVPQWVKMRELFGGTPSLIPDLVTAGSGGKDLTIGDLYKTKREQAVKDYEAKVQRFKDAGEYNPGIDESLKSLLNQRLESLAQEEVGYLNQLPQRQTLSNLLRENKFEEAYKFAQDNGMQMLLFRGDQLKDLREPFTKDEAKAFMRAMPYEFFKSAYGDQYEFEKAFKFDPEGAEKRGALNWVAFDQSGRPMIEETKEGVKAVQSETGYPALERIFELQEIKKDPGIFEKIFKVAAIGTALVGGAQLLGGLSGGAGAAGAAGAGGAGAAGAGTAGAGAAGTGALAGGAALPTFTIATGGGLTGAQLAALGATGAAGASALGGGATGAPTTTTPPPDNLAEVVVQASKRGPYSLLGPGTLASTSLMTPGSVSDIPTDIYGRVQGEPDLTEGKLDAAEAEYPKEPFQDRLDEVIVTGSKYKPGLIDLATIGTGGLTAAQLLKGYTEPTLRPYEELPPEGEPMEEVIVTGSKPPPIDLMDVGVGGLTAAQLLQGFTQPKVDPFTGEPTEPPKTEQELDKIAEALKAGTTIPGTGGVLDRLRNLLGDYATPENLLKLIGSLGAAGAGGAKPTTGAGVGAGGMGGALPKYTYTRQQLSPDIDYYTYGTRPEAKFFEYGLQLEKPEQPAAPAPDTGVVNPEDQPVFATGGLTGYAKGGSKSSRYVDGPGSGRDDKIPALLSDGEYVIDAETLALLGDGSTKEGARRMDRFRANIRKHKGRALSRGRISPNAKSPDKYMGGGLT